MFVVAVACAFFVLFFHAWQTRGLKNAIKIFGFGIVVFTAKEIENRINQPVRYVPSPDAFFILGVPVVVVLGWIFAIYIGWQMAETILAGLASRRSDRLFPIISLASLIVFCIGLLMEVHGTLIGWWEWTVQDILDFRPKWLGLPLLMPLEWARVCFSCLTYGLLLEYSPLKKHRFRYLHCIAGFLITSLLYLPLLLLEHFDLSSMEYDNPIVLSLAGLLLLAVALWMRKNPRPANELYFFTFWLQIYNFFIDPFTWVAGGWILLTIVGYFFYTKIPIEYGIGSARESAAEG